MNGGFWQTLKKPIFALAPMHDVTDAAFRQLLAEVAKPDVIYTEFVSVDGLNHPASQEKMIAHYLGYSEKERPILAQIWGNNPKYFQTAARLIEQLGFDGIDINMGCPDKQVVKLGGGAALMQNSDLAKEIIQATKDATTLPVSVKTRLGFDTINFDFIREIITTHPAALTIHGRTRKELSLVPAHWDIIAQIAPEIKKEGIICLGNGDISSHTDALEKIKTSGVDGVMIGRGVFGNPWIFSPQITEVSLIDKLRVLRRHTEIFKEVFEETKNFSVLKKHVRGYIHGFDGAKEMRNEIMDTKTLQEMQEVLEHALLDTK